MDEIRCGNCRKLLARGTAIALQIKCPRCRALNVFNNPKATEPPCRATRSPGGKQSDSRPNHSVDRRQAQAGKAHHPEVPGP
ncbi:MAG: Com family DNA-binding transcriptional regulator [Rhodocyclaceae bacterium]